MVGGRLAGGQPPLSRDFDGKNDSLVDKKKRNGLFDCNNPKTRSHTKATAPEPIMTLATQDPRSGTPHHTNSEYIAHAPKSTGSGEIEATIARQHKSIETTCHN